MGLLAYWCLQLNLLRTYLATFHIEGLFAPRCVLLIIEIPLWVVSLGYGLFVIYLGVAIFRVVDILLVGSYYDELKTIV